MFQRDSNSWQLILADLALILFLVATAAIADEGETGDIPSDLPPVADVPAQAIYRPHADAIDIAAWVEQNGLDPRMTLTVVATHEAGRAEAAWHEANALAQAARNAGVMVRVVLREGSKPDLYASLGYDEPG